MKWVLTLLGAIVLGLGILTVLAFTSPAVTEHNRTITLKETPEAIFAVLADVQKMPDWNRDLAKIDILPPAEGKETTRQTFKNGMAMTVVTTESLSPTHLVRAMQTSDKMPFVGTWTYEITPVENGTKVTLTEVSEIKKPLFRLMVRLFGATKYMDAHLVDLARHFGENARPH